MDERREHRNGDPHDDRDDRDLRDRDSRDQDIRDRDYRAGYRDRDRDYRRDYRDREYGRDYRDRDYRYDDRDYRYERDYRYDASAPVGSKFAGGIVAGIVAAVLMMGSMMAYSNAIGEGITMPLKALGALVYGVEALVAGSTAMAAGAGIELAFSIAIGILFGLAMSRRSSVILTMLSGIIVGIAIWVAMDLYVLPQMDPTMSARIALMPMAYFGAHVLFGIGLGLTPLFVRAFSGGRRRSRETRRMERPA
jgi:hypothetical protein